MRANKKDNNHKELVSYAESLGFSSIDVSMMKNFCDVILGIDNKVYFCEIKDGSKAPSQRRLSEGELKFKFFCAANNFNWRLLESKADINELYKETL